METPAIARWAGSAHWQHHPLAWLPLELSGLEVARTLPAYHSRGGSYTAVFGPSGTDAEPFGRSRCAPVM